MDYQRRDHTKEQAYARLRLSIDTNKQLVDFVFDEVNDTFVSWFRHTRTQLLGTKFSLMNKDDCELEVDWLSFINASLNDSTGRTSLFKSKAGNRYYRVTAFSPSDDIAILLISDATTDELLLKNQEQFEKRQVIDSAQLWHLVMDHLPAALWVKDSDGNMIYMNKWMSERVDLSPSDIEKALQSDEQTIKKGSTFMLNQEINFRNLGERILRVFKHPVEVELGRRPYILGVGFDFTNELRIAEELRSSEEKFRFITENASDVIWIFNATLNRFTYFSPSVFNLRGFTVEESLTQTVRQLLTPESAEKVKKIFTGRSMQFAKSGDAPIELVEVQFTTKSGKPIWTETSARLRTNPSGQVEAIGVSRNIENRKRQEERINYMTHHDHLTDVFNRRYFELQSQELMAADNYPLTVVMADLNGLKLANDAFGHRAGDALLQQFAEVLKKCTRKEDIVARLGGDEFVIILPQTSEKGAQVFLRRLKQTLTNTRVGALSLSASFGSISVDQPGTPLDELYHEADEKMYLQKIIDGTRYKRDTVHQVADYLFGKYPVERIHGEKVAQWSALIAKSMGLEPEVVKAIEKVALLHDIGRVALPDKYNDGKTEPEDTDISAIRRLPEVGYHILKGSDEYSSYADFVLYHHENSDGTGYPRGLKGDDIPLASRIMKVADMYDTMIRFEGYSAQDTVKHLLAKRDILFDAQVIDIFVQRVINLSI